MSGRLNWQKANQDRRMREQGISPLEDLLAPHPFGDKLSPKGNLIVGGKAAKKLSPKNRRKTKQPKKTKAHYLEAGVTALVRGEPQPKPFKKLSAGELQEIQSYPSRLDWARAQSGFTELESRAREKLRAIGMLKSASKKPKVLRSHAADASVSERMRFLRSEVPLVS